MRKYYFFILSVVLLLSSRVNAQTTKILCLGNSITNGEDKYNSYRRDLWKMLHDANYDVDFIGSWNKHHMGTPVPNPDFDMDHEGHAGWTFEDFFFPPSWDTTVHEKNIYDWFKMYIPDIVLIELGTNDVFQCVPVDTSVFYLKKIIEVIKGNNNNAKIFLSKVPPLGKQWSPKKLCGDSVSYAQKIIRLNKSFVDFIKREAPYVEIVDQYTGVDPAIDTFDDIHPNDKGEKIMAERWYKAIVKYLHKK